MSKVIIFCDYFGNGGIEKVSIKLKEQLEKNGFSVDLLATIYNSSLYDKCISISRFKTLNPIYRFIKTFFNIKKYTSYADVVHINMHSSVNLLYACLINKKKKVYVHAHSSKFKKDIFLIKSFINMIFRFFFNRKRFNYIACSKSAGDFCFGNKVNYEIVQNTFDSDKFTYNSLVRKKMRHKYKISNDTFVMGHIGRFSIQKNHEFMIKIFKDFLSLNNNAIIFFIGEGEEKNRIKCLVNKYCLDDKIIFIDKVNNPSDYYQMFDVFLFPSLFEGYGICVYEALCSSLRVFISDAISENFNKDENLFSLSLTDCSRKWAEFIFENSNYERVKRNNVDYFNKDINRVYGLLNDKISIIVPAYNSGTTIKRCVDSILSQTYSNFEVIIINDGSVDNTKKIITKYKDERIIIINQKNLGTGSARNKGLLKCKGKYVAFIDSDDEIKPTFLEDLYKNIIYFDSDIACSMVKNKNTCCEVLNREKAFYKLLDIPETISMSVCRKLFKKEILKNIKFDEKNHYEDIAFAVRVFLNSNKIVLVPKSLYIYHKMIGSRSSLYYQDERILSCLECLNYVKIQDFDLFGRYIVYTLFNSLGVFNKMIKFNSYDSNVVNRIFNLIKDNYNYIIFSNYPIYKKIQLLLFYKFNKIYIFFYKCFRRNNL
ncbi:MAG: glycosyltransferase [Bacilli bacterium]|nr:glycosyltransferase [Bacilli bacterium]